MDAIEVIAKHIVDTSYENLPSNMVDLTKRQILNSLALALAGSKEAGVAEILDILGDWGGKKESTVWVYGNKLPSISAAQVNAIMIHALDWDDTHDTAILHPSVTTVPVCLAIAESLGGINGKKVITALVMGNELATRLCLANKISMFESGWHYTTLHGCFNAAAVAGKLLDLDQEKLINAFGLAYHQASGNSQCVHDGALAKRVGPSLSTRNGIWAAMMAQKGITGARNVLEGRHGLFNVYHRGEYNPELLTIDFGKNFEGANVSFKPYPCCRSNHPSIDATLAIVLEQDIKADNVDSVTLYISKNTLKTLGLPLDIKRNPRTTVDAQFSLPWTVASAIVHRKVTIDDFTPEAIKDNKVLALSNKVTPEFCQDVNKDGVSPAIVEIKTKEGKIYSRRVDYPLGSPKNPLSMDDLVTQFRDCASHAAKPLSSGNLEKVIQMVLQIEAVSDVGEIARLLA